MLVKMFLWFQLVLISDVCSRVSDPFGLNQLFDDICSAQDSGEEESFVFTVCDLCLQSVIWFIHDDELIIFSFLNMIGWKQ